MIEAKTVGDGVAVSVDAKLPELIMFLDKTTEHIIKKIAEKDPMKAMAASVVINRAIIIGIDAALAEDEKEGRTPS